MWSERSDSIRRGVTTVFNYIWLLRRMQRGFRGFCVLTRFPHYSVVTWKLRRDISPRELAVVQCRRPRRLRKILNPTSGVAWTLICLQYATRIGVIFGNIAGARALARRTSFFGRDFKISSFVKMCAWGKNIIPKRRTERRVNLLKNANNQ